MNKYEEIEILLNTLSDKYPGYLIGFDEHPEIIIIAIENRSSRLIYKKAIQKPVDISFVENVIERMINDEMRGDKE